MAAARLRMSDVLAAVDATMSMLQRQAAAERGPEDAGGGRAVAAVGGPAAGEAGQAGTGAVEGSGAKGGTRVTALAAALSKAMGIYDRAAHTGISGELRVHTHMK